MNEKTQRVIIICGSDTDLPQVRSACENVPWKKRITIYVISCHRNPQDLKSFIFNRLTDGDIVIGAGGKALALPGIIDAWAHFFRKNIRVAGVALGEPGSNALLAAQLSIEEIPGQPVIINEVTGKAYTGTNGLRELLDRIESGKLPPPKPRKEKPVQLNVPI